MKFWCGAPFSGVDAPQTIIPMAAQAVSPSEAVLAQLLQRYPYRVNGDPPN